jgi:probable rRNA maturation factor
MVHLVVRNDSRLKGLYRTNDLQRLAQHVCDGERYSRDAELSLLLCDDALISRLNRTYRKKRGPTDVLSFGCRAPRSRPLRAQDGASFSVLGDIVISLETVEARCTGNRAAMRGEIRLLFCHGLLHLLGFVHDTKSQRARMQAKQAHYLDIGEKEAWIFKA